MKQKKTLQDLSLIDNFLFGAMMTDPDVGIPFSRKLIKLILGKEIADIQITPQKVFYGVDTDMHGARLDVYIEETVSPDGRTEEMAQIIEDDSSIFDIEPEKNHDTISIEGLPKRVRFYHAKIDNAALPSGEDYRKLKKVYVIFITPFDPFGYNRMVYTIKNYCVEQPDMEYEDGAMTIFLYTKGSVGNYSEDLQKFLTYFEESTDENAVTDDLRELQSMVSQIKDNREVGLSYMRAYEEKELLKRIYHNQGLEEGRAEGREEGREEGRAEGREEGRAEGRRQNVISVIMQQMNRGKSTSQIADFLDIDVAEVQRVYDIGKKYAPEYDLDAIYKELYS